VEPEVQRREARSLPTYCLKLGNGSTTSSAVFHTSPQLNHARNVASYYTQSRKKVRGLVHSTIALFLPPPVVPDSDQNGRHRHQREVPQHT
jgi:hypothetical protein